MFILKFFIFLLILFAVIFNGLVLWNSPNMETAEKIMGIVLYLIIVLVIANYTVSYVTYHNTKNKRGIVGDSGIKGQTGNKGKPAICEADCGRKICFVNVTEHADNVLNNDLDKVRGMVELKYDVDPKKAHKHKDRILRQFIHKLRIKFGVFSLPTDDDGTVSKDFVTIFVKNDGLRIRISNSKQIVDGIINDIDHGSNNRKKYLNIFLDGPKEPKINLKNLEALSKCMETTSEDYKPDDVNPTENKIIVELCSVENDDEEEENNENSETTSANIVNFETVMNKKLNIRNEYFIEKIKKICNSEEYLNALEKKTKNRVNEEQLIEYIKSIIEEMVSYLVNFKVRRKGGREDGKIIYAGLNFLLTKTADKNYFEIYRTGPSDSDKIPSPLIELEKYDIFRWGENYINSPLIIEQCNAHYKLPDGKEQDLVIVKSNNYKFLYNSTMRKDVFYVGYTDNCDTYCPYNQMGDDKTNNEGKQVCMYYNINEKSHRNLKGTHPVWAETQYMKPGPLSLYHLEKSTFIDPGGVSSQKYYQDANGISYYPIGSVWTSKIEHSRKNRNHFTPNSHNKASGHSGVGPEKETVVISGNVLPPVDYNKIWNSKDGCADCQPGSEITIWEPIPPKGYVCLGHMVSDINDKTELLDATGVEDAPVMCLPEACVLKIPIGPQVWNAEKLSKKEFGTETFESKDRFILYLNCLLKENNFRTSEEILKEIDDFVVTETERLSTYNVDTSVSYAYADQDFLINELNELKNLKLFKDWDRNNLVQLYKDSNKIIQMAKEIEEKYQVRFDSMKDSTIKEIKKLKLKITPRVSAAKPVYIYSAGADKAYEESFNLTNVQIKNDQGHNLFLAVTDKANAPKFAYKINRECLYKKKYKPIKLNTVPGVLNYRNNERNSSGKSSEEYFTYPKDLIIESLSDQFSPTKDPKRYYLSFSNQVVDLENNKPPTYFIRAPNVKLKDFTLCKIGTVDEQIIDDVMDTKNPRALFVIEDENNQPLVTFNSETEKNPIKLRNIGVENSDNSLYYDQYYTPFGRNVETLSTINTGNFKFKRVI
jgi:hypothetical protein